MDFFGAQDRARRLSGWLVALFGLAVVVIAVTVYLVVILVLGDDTTGVWQPGIFLLTVGGVGVLVGLCSAVRTASLRSGGGSSVAEMLGGREIPSLTDDPDERRLRNVVEETALAAGVPVPSVYVLDGESRINAFAAGYSTEDAVVAVTRGALEHFTRDELQGVVAHEFSHILNRDIRLNIRLTGLLFGILALGLAGRLVLRSMYGVRGGGRNKGQAIAIALAVGLTLFVAGYLGVFFGRIIRAAVSRQREYLADAAAVQFTRNPDGLASALKKVGAAGSRIDSASAEEVSHFFFASGLRRGLVSGLWTTHPPLVDRIRRLDPQFDGDFQKVRLDRAAELEPPAPPSRRAAAADQGSALVAGLAAASTGAAAGWTDADPAVGAARVLDLPEALRDVAHDPFSAVGLTYALMLSRDDASRERQRAVLEAGLADPLLRQVERLEPAVRGLDDDARLALVDLAAPALRQLSETQAAKLGGLLGEVARADRRLSLFEFALETAVRHRLAATHGRAGRGERLGLRDILPDALVLLSALAHAGQRGAEAVRAAFLVGAEALDAEVGADALVGCTSSEVVEALERLAEARLEVRDVVMTACGRTALHDHVVRSAEAHLLRAIAAALDVPSPTYLPRFDARQSSAQAMT